MGGLFSSAQKQNDYQATNPYEDQYQKDMIKRQTDLHMQQNSLGDTLRAQMAGGGPNPAQTQYLSNTQNNIANTQGLIASQRGLNPALAARMGANAAARANQEATMGSALVQQNQQLAAQGQLQGLLGQVQGGNVAYQGGYNQMHGAQEGINAGISQKNAENKGALTGMIMGGIANAATGGMSGLATKGVGMLGSQTPGKAHGGIVGGQPNVAGDSPQNDTVNTMLSPGEIVIPRSMAHDADKAKDFIDHLLESKNKKKSSYGDVLKARKKKSA